MPDEPLGTDPFRGKSLPEVDIKPFEAALKSLNIKFADLYKSTSAAQEIVSKYEQELSKGTVTQKTLMGFQKAQSEAAKASSEILKQKEDFIAKTRLRLLEEGYSPERINQILRELKLALGASEDFSKSLSSMFKVGTKVEPPSSFIENIWKKILAGAGIVGAGEGKKTADILLGTIASVSEKILSAVGIFTLFQTVMQAVIQDAYQSQRLFGGFAQVLGTTNETVATVARQTLPELRNSFAQSTSGMGSAGKKMLGMMTEEADQAIDNFQKLAAQGKLTRFDFEKAAGGIGTSAEKLAVQARETVIAVDSWGRASQAFGLTSEQGAEKAGKMMTTFGFQGNKLRDVFSQLSINANQSWQTFDKFSDAVATVGDRLRLAGGTQSEVFNKSIKEIEVFGSIIASGGAAAGYSGAAISQMFDVMLNKVNGLSLSFRLAALQAGGMTQGLTAGRAIFESYSKGPVEILSGLGTMFSKSLGSVKTDSKELAGLMMQALSIPADQAALVAPSMERFAKAIQSMPEFKEGKFDLSKMTDTLQRAGMSRQQAENMVAAGKAMEDPMKAIKKLLENLVKLISNMANLGVLMRAPFGTEG